MKTISVKAVKREEYGKKAAKAVRREGMVPCVLSGHGESVAFSVDTREIKPQIYTPNSYIVEFDFDGKKEQAVLREAQFHPVREQILHLDFYRIADGKPVSIAIPVRLTGNAEGVKVGGKLALSARKLVVSALVENLPDELVVDVTTLGVGTLRLRPKGSAGGHNGLKNIAELLGTENFARMRFGVGGDFPKGHQVDYVLGEWSEEDRKAMPERLKVFCDAILSFATIGVERTMNFLPFSAVSPWKSRRAVWTRRMRRDFGGGASGGWRNGRPAAFGRRLGRRIAVAGMSRPRSGVCAYSSS